MNLGAKRRVLEHDVDATTWRDRAAQTLDDQCDALAAVLAHLRIAEAIAEHRRDEPKLTATRSYQGLVREWVTTLTDEATELRAAGDDRRALAPIDFARRAVVEEAP